ncbi:hypothetical protein [Infirmifilum sp. NZ]|uniref:hypothetical protein n=1 Tax=Infirmifilum sp. NZ TaxID=2926850 RepID=UPI0027A627F9|nr:hypothetical protein [Infirmifilum sp. NZ]UNQ73566.1 hypothetical protein MOV14_00785 [Infirmifilum sp. NZ]
MYVGRVKTTLELPKDVYIELKRRALEEGKTLREVILEAILSYLASPRTRGSAYIDILLRPVEGAGPEDYSEYEGEDID